MCHTSHQKDHRQSPHGSWCRFLVQENEQQESKKQAYQQQQHLKPDPLVIVAGDDAVSSALLRCLLPASSRPPLRSSDGQRLAVALLHLSLIILIPAILVITSQHTTRVNRDVRL